MSSLANLSKACSLHITRTPAPSARRSPLVRGVLWMLLAMSCIALVDGVAKFLAIDLNGVQVAWAYFVAMFVNLIAFGLVRRVPVRTFIRTTQLKLQVLRAACLVGSLSCLFFSLRYLPLAEATSISFTSPLFIVALAGPMLKEQVGWAKWMAVLVGLFGALLIVRPGSDVLGWAAFLPLIGAVFFAFFSIVTRMLGNRENILTTLFYTTAGGSILLSVVMPFIWQTPGAQQILILLGSGTLGLIAHLSMVQAMRLADASTLAPMNYVRLVWALGIGWWLFAQIPDALSLIGGTIIVGSGLYVISGSSSQSRAKKAQ